MWSEKEAVAPPKVCLRKDLNTATESDVVFKITGKQVANVM